MRVPLWYVNSIRTQELNNSKIENVYHLSMSVSIIITFLCGKIKIYSSTHMKNISLTEMLKVSRNDHAGSSMASSNVH